MAAARSVAVRAAACDVADRAGAGFVALCAVAIMAAGATAFAAPARADVARRDLGPNAAIPFPLFPADNVWNTPVDALPVDANSADYIAGMGLGAEIHADFGTVWNGAPNGIPYVCVPGTQPKVPISFYYGPESDPGPYPIPADAPIEGGPGSTGDRHVLVLDVDNHMLYEVYDAHRQSNGSWEAGSGAVFDLTSNAPRPDGWTSADAAGLPMLPGLVRYDEVVTGGEINHALRFTVAATQRSYLYPATHFASDQTDPDLPPMGLRVRLKAGVDISGMPEEVQVICRALKTYGMIVADNGGPWYISGAPDRRWDDDALHAISQLRGGDFEVVDTRSLEPGALLVDAGADVVLREGETLTRAGAFSPSVEGQSAAWSGSVSWGDGSASAPLALTPPSLPVPPATVGGPGTFVLSHRYIDNGLRVVQVAVAGDGGTLGSARFSARIRNVPPAVRAGRAVTLRLGAETAAGTTAASGALLRRTIRFSDPGADRFRARIAWGDGSGVRRLGLGARRKFAIRHSFARSGVYTLSVNVIDDDGGRGIDRFRVTVRR